MERIKLPMRRRRTTHATMPDVTARLQKVFGRKIISDQTMKQILAKNQGNY